MQRGTDPGRDRGNSPETRREEVKDGKEMPEIPADPEY